MACRKWAAQVAAAARSRAGGGHAEARRLQCQDGCAFHL